MEVIPPETLLPPRNSVSSSASAASSPEFEFWMLRNPSNPQPRLLSADELFVDGVILPLQPLHTQPTQPTASDDRPEPPIPDCQDDPPPPLPQPATSASVDPAAASVLSSAKKWKDIFRGVGGGKKVRDDARRRYRRTGAGGAAELNINIWPFSRSRSAGNSAVAGTRRKATVSGRRVSSAPCSRSNSRGESSRIGAAIGGRSPARVGGGIHVGRNNPIWLVRRSKKMPSAATATAVPATEAETKEVGEPESGGVKKVNGSGGVGIRVLNLKVNSCIGYSHQSRCDGDEKDEVTAGEQLPGGGGGGVVGGCNGGSHFKLKALFSKKAH